jgi:hypothetical protein
MMNYPAGVLFLLRSMLTGDADQVNPRPDPDLDPTFLIYQPDLRISSAGTLFLRPVNPITCNSNFIELNVFYENFSQLTFCSLNIFCQGRILQRIRIQTLVILW